MTNPLQVLYSVSPAGQHFVDLKIKQVYSQAAKNKDNMPIDRKQIDIARIKLDPKGNPMKPKAKLSVGAAVWGDEDEIGSEVLTDDDYEDEDDFVEGYDAVIAHSHGQRAKNGFGRHVEAYEKALKEFLKGV